MDLLRIPYEHQITFEWKIKKSELRHSKWTPHNYASKSADVRYCFKILPNEDTEQTNGQTMILLFIVIGKVEEVKAELTVSIESANFNRSCEDIVTNENDGKRIVLCEINGFFDVANKYFVNDEIIIKINGTLKFDRLSISKMPLPFSTTFEFTAASLKTFRTKDFLIGITKRISSNPEIKYCFHFYPHGRNEESQGKVFISLHMEFENDKKIETFYICTVNSGIWCGGFYANYEKSGTYGTTLFSTKELLEIDGEITVSLEGRCFVEKKVPEFTLLDNCVADESSRISSEAKDFKIIVGENEIDVNKDLLSSVSSVCNRMLQSGMKETVEGKMEITDFPFKTVDYAVKLIYGISPIFTLDDMLPLVVFSDKYDIQIIKDLVENHLIKELSTSNVCQIIHFSTLFNAQKLYEKSTEFFIQCSRNSTFVNDLDLIDKEMFYKIFHGTFPSDC